MALDARLVDGAGRARERLEDAERENVLAKAEYHAAVRRLHAAGGSVREIGQALGISFQRVQQIVDGAGGSWWSRIWRTRGERRDAVCTFCERPPSEVAKLIAGPDVYICDRCVSTGEAVVGGVASSEARISATTTRTRCSFCGKSRALDRPVVQGGDGRICRDCLALCREILDHGTVPAAH